MGDITPCNNIDKPLPFLDQSISQISGDFTLSQCHAICRYLGEEFGLSPDTKEEKARADQLSLTCHDYIAEGRLFLKTLSISFYLSICLFVCLWY